MNCSLKLRHWGKSIFWTAGSALPQGLHPRNPTSAQDAISTQPACGFPSTFNPPREGRKNRGLARFLPILFEAFGGERGSVLRLATTHFLLTISGRSQVAPGSCPTFRACSRKKESPCPRFLAELPRPVEYPFENSLSRSSEVFRVAWRHHPVPDVSILSKEKWRLESTEMRLTRIGTGYSVTPEDICSHALSLLSAIPRHSAQRTYVWLCSESSYPKEDTRSGKWLQLPIASAIPRLVVTSRAGARVFAERNAETVGADASASYQSHGGVKRAFGSAGRWRRCKWCASLTWVTVTSIIRGNRADKHDSSLSRVLLCRAPSWTAKLERVDAAASSWRTYPSARASRNRAILLNRSVPFSREPSASRTTELFAIKTFVSSNQPAWSCRSLRKTCCHHFQSNATPALEERNFDNEPAK